MEASLQCIERMRKEVNADRLLGKFCFKVKKTAQWLERGGIKEDPLKKKKDGN